MEKMVQDTQHKDNQGSHIIKIDCTGDIKYFIQLTDKEQGHIAKLVQRDDNLLFSKQTDASPLYYKGKKPSKWGKTPLYALFHSILP